MSARVFSRWIAVLGCILAFEAGAQQAPLLQSTASFSSAGCYSFLPRCFVFAEAIDGDTAVTSTTAATIAVHTRADDGWIAQQAVTNPDYSSPPTQYSPQRHFGYPSASAATRSSSRDRARNTTAKTSSMRSREPAARGNKFGRSRRRDLRTTTRRS